MSPLHRVVLALGAALVLVSAAGCGTSPVVVERPATPATYCSRREWVRPYYDHRGIYHEGHWRCA